MQAMVIKELKENRRGLLIWIGVMLGMILIGAAEYSVVIEAGESIMELFESLPPVLAIGFGIDSIPVNTPLGYYVMMYLWYCIIAFTHAAVLGATIISKEERNRTAEFIFTKPFARKEIITSKIIASIINVVIITLVTLIGNLIMLLPKIEGANIISEIVTTLFFMLIIQILFLFIGFLFSAIFSSYGKALSISALFVAFSYVLMVIIKLMESIKFISFLTPFMYFTGTGLVENGFSFIYILLAVIVITVAGYLTYYKYESRDLQN